jgi:carboxyl-terminal processing protease
MRGAARALPWLLVAAGAFWLGRLSTPTLAHAAPGSYEKLDIFGRVLAYLENNYVDDLPSETLMYGAIRGMVETTHDPYTTFLRPEELRALSAPLEAGAVGLELAEREGRVVVIGPIDNGPATRAGILRGDVLESLDGAPVAGLSLVEVLRKLRGPAGSTLALSLRRGETLVTLSLSREVMPETSTSWRGLEKGLGYLRIRQFQDRTSREAEEALASLEARREGLRGLVLDLRDNPGGLFDQAVAVADLFLSEGVIVSTEGRAGTRPEVWYARPKGTRSTLPVVVLVNGGTASSAEIVAAALQENRRAVLCGEKTFGKGSVQSLLALEDGSGLKVTVARYFTPKHRSIHGAGLRPEIVITETPSAETDAVLTAALARLSRSSASGRAE